MYSAASLFTTRSDVSFRLMDTYLIYDGEPCRVIDVGGGHEAEESTLYLAGLNKDTFAVPLAEIPVDVMFDCPSGYIDETWYARVPTRTYRQGIIKPALVGRQRGFPYLHSLPGPMHLDQVLSGLLAQTERAHSNKRHRTRDVLITSGNNVLIRGYDAGVLIGGSLSRVKMHTDWTPFEEHLLCNANLSPEL